MHRTGDFSLADKYFNNIPKRATIKGLLNVVTEDEIRQFITKPSSSYSDKDISQVTTEDGAYFHKSNDGMGYVFYATGRGVIFDFFEDKSMRQVFGAYLSYKLSTFNHHAKDMDEYQSDQVQASTD